MVLSAPWAYSLEIIAFHTIKKLQGINPMGISDPWSNSLDIIALQPVDKN